MPRSRAPRPRTTASERSGSGSDALSSMLRRGAATVPTLVHPAGRSTRSGGPRPPLPGEGRRTRTTSMRATAPAGSDDRSCRRRRALRAAGCTSTFPPMEGVTVVDHVLLKRLLSILRDKDTPHRVFRETLTDAALILGYEAMRGLRGEQVRVQTPLEESAGVRLADEVFVVAILRAGLGLVDGFLRLLARGRGGPPRTVPG